MEKLTGIKTYDSKEEKKTRMGMFETFKNCPIPDDQVLSNLGLFLNSKNLSRILFMDHLYRHVVEVPGQIFEFGTRWGQNIALFAALRGIYEPFNRHRTIIGFDTFTGFPSISAKDGSSDMMKDGNLSVTENYDKYLSDIMNLQEQDNPLSHIKKYEIHKGDAVIEVEKYLDGRREANTWCAS